MQILGTLNADVHPGKPHAHPFNEMFGYKVWPVVITEPNDFSDCFLLC